MDYYAIGQRIRKIRKARGLSQEELAEQVGISTTHMSHIETGNTKMSLSIFAALAAALGAHSDEILYGEAPLGRSAPVMRIAELLEGCTTAQVRVMEDILRAVAESFRANL